MGGKGLYKICKACIFRDFNCEKRQKKKKQAWATPASLQAERRFFEDNIADLEALYALATASDPALLVHGGDGALWIDLTVNVVLQSPITSLQRACEDDVCAFISRPPHGIFFPVIDLSSSPEEVINIGGSKKKHLYFC